MRSYGLILFLCFLLSLARAQANFTCETFFSDVKASSANQAIGDGNEPIYIPTGNILNNKDTRSLNQCRSSECYLFAFLGAIEVQNQNRRNNPEAPRLSGAYLVAHKLHHYIDNMIWYGPKNTGYSLRGGYLYDALYFSRHHGLMPEESWQPRVPFDEWDFARIYVTLEEKALEWNKKISSLARTHGPKSKIVEEAYFKGTQQLHDVVATYSGPLTTQIEFRNQTLSTKDIDRQYGFDHRTTVMMMYPRGKFSGDPDTLKKKLDAATLPFSGAWSYESADWKEIELTMTHWLKQSAPVLVDVEWNKDRHSLVVTDYEAENGYIKRWKVKNSWGNSFGDKGYAWYSYQDLRKNLVRTWRFGSPSK